MHNISYWTNATSGLLFGVVYCSLKIWIHTKDVGEFYFQNISHLMIFYFVVKLCD